MQGSLEIFAVRKIVELTACLVAFLTTIATMRQAYRQICYRESRYMIQCQGAMLPTNMLEWAMMNGDVQRIGVPVSHFFR